MISNKIILLIGISFLFVILSFYLINFNLVEEKSVPVDLEVGSTAGFNLDSDALHFGRILPGDASQRFLLLRNDFSFPIRAKLESEGEIKDFLFFEEEFFLKPEEEVQIGVSVNIPDDQSYGNYSGELVLRIYVG